ncbi:MAG: hypothetical protein Kow00122_02250 [Thermoleophilia bacterium]|nr:hypothetical protein [Actinomycetota bacterium]
MTSTTTERVLAFLLMIATGVAATWVFHWVSPDLTGAPLFSAVLAYWILFFVFFYGPFLGLGSEGARGPEVTLRKAVGSAVAFLGTAISVALSMTLTGDGALATNQEMVLSLLPLHWGFVWLVLVQHLGLA